MRHRRRQAKTLTRPPLTEDQILAWADAHHDLFGKWPTKKGRAVLGAPNERWSAIDSALQQGLRGLNVRSSLPQLLAVRRGVRHRMALPHFTIRQILQWCDDYHK